MSKTDPKHWCGTCQGLRNLLELATREIEKMSPKEKAEFRQDLRRQMGMESDTEFLKQCGIDAEG